MTQPHTTPGGAHPRPGQDPENDQERSGPVIRDKRRIDPETGEVREGAAGAAPADPSGTSQDADASDVPGSDEDVHPDTLVAAERLEEMRRMQAEFVNFRNRTQREREADKDRHVGAVIEALLPVMDDIHHAREHGDLVEGPFAAIVDKLEQALGRFGAQRVGEVGDVFDPTVHEALMHLSADSPGVDLPEGATEMTIVKVIQPGFKVGDMVVRAARVAVADPS